MNIECTPANPKFSNNRDICFIFYQLRNNFTQDVLLSVGFDTTTISFPAETPGFHQSSVKTRSKAGNPMPKYFSKRFLFSAFTIFNFREFSMAPMPVSAASANNATAIEPTRISEELLVLMPR